jgi:hypothetical protein
MDGEVMQDVSMASWQQALVRVGWSEAERNPAQHVNQVLAQFAALAQLQLGGEALRELIRALRITAEECDDSLKLAAGSVGRSRGSVMDELRESTEPYPVDEPEDWPDDDWSDL